jgi:phosphatidylserine/phosphatidylglycerophosphate/cardiolipin synthase-like enzyme
VVFPDDGVSARIVELINAAQDNIHFLAFSFTSNDIADAIIGRSGAGVLVQGVFDEDQLDNPGGEFVRMLTEGLDVSVDANPDKLHHKLIVIDGKIVITGSYNFSASAEEVNDENVAIIFSEEVARVVGEAQR